MAELEVLRSLVPRPKPLFTPKLHEEAGHVLEPDELFAGESEDMGEDLEIPFAEEERVKREIQWTTVRHLRESAGAKREPMGPLRDPAWVNAYLEEARAVVKPRDHGLNILVYKKLDAFATQKSKQEKKAELEVPAASLWFDSNFESANLERAILVSPTEYDLYLCHDYNTAGHTQWYYFRMERGIPGVAYEFHIRNLEKAGSLYNEGMLPCFYSETAARERGQG